MADLRDQYGNLVHQTDEYGNPIQNQYPAITGGGASGGAPPMGGTGTGYDTSGGIHMGDNPQMQQDKHHGRGVTGMLQRSGSSSSSSSEDDGEGGRRKKKGLKEKIKEKLPGGGQKNEPGYGSTTTTTTAATGLDPQEHDGSYEQQEKKGIMDKIKEKLPGSH